MCEEGWRFVVVDMGAVFLRRLVSFWFLRLCIASGLVASSEGSCRVLQ